MKVTIDPKTQTMTIVIETQEPTASESGKTLIVATTRGNKEVPGVKIDGKPLYIGLNAYIYATEKGAKAK